jgi:hypothetical protein
MEDFIKQIEKEWIKPYFEFEMEKKTKPWPCAGIIPKASRNLIDKLEYGLIKRGIGSVRMFVKWRKTVTDELVSKIDLDVKDISIETNEKTTQD